MSTRFANPKAAIVFKEKSSSARQNSVEASTFADLNLLDEDLQGVTAPTLNYTSNRVVTDNTSLLTAVSALDAAAVLLSATNTLTGVNTFTALQWFMNGFRLFNQKTTIASLDTATDIITTAANHGLTTGDAVRFVGATGATLPAGTTEATVYYVNVGTANTITLHTDPAKATAGTPKVDLTASQTGTVYLVAEPTAFSEGMFWLNNKLKLYLNGGSIDIADHVTGLSKPKQYNMSARPVYASTTTFTMATINCRNSANTGDIVKTTSTTVTISATGINGCAVSSNLVGTVTIGAGATAVVGTSTTFLTSFQVGDVITPNGGNPRRITVITDDTHLTLESSSAAGALTGVTYIRGGRAPNTWYNLYAITDGVTPGLILSTRNVAGGDTIVDLPAGYSFSRQMPFASRFDGSSLMIPWYYCNGWVYYSVTTTDPATPTAGTTNILLNGSATSYTSVSAASFIPPISKLGKFNFLSVWVSANGTQFLRTAGVSQAGYAQRVTSIGALAYSPLEIETNSSQAVEYKGVATTVVHLDVLGFYVTEVV